MLIGFGGIIITIVFHWNNFFDSLWYQQLHFPNGNAILNWWYSGMTCNFGQVVSGFSLKNAEM